MNSLVNKFSRFHRWVTTTISKQPLLYFRRTFAAIWLVYDIIDISTGGTVKSIWFYHLPINSDTIIGIQIVLIASELGMLFNRYPRALAFVAFLARGYESHLVTLNDFFYFTVTALILSQCDTRGKKTLGWPRDLFVMQTGWIYFASALLKLNPPFLSGRDLYTRQNYEVAVLSLPYPHFYRGWISTLTGNSVLSWAAVVMEMSLAMILFIWVFCPRQRKKLHLIALALALAIHSYAAYALNVFFFGASMIAQIGFLTWEPKNISKE